VPVEVIVERCAGIDVGKRDVKACIRVPDVAGRWRVEVRTFTTMTRDLLLLRDWLVGEGISTVGMEATGAYWKPVYYLLEDSFTVQLLNARHLHNVPGRKTDVIDAEWICRMVQHGLVRPSFVPPAPIRQLRDLTRYRTEVVRERVRDIARLEKLLEDAEIKLSAVVADLLGKSARATLEAMVAGQRDPQVLADMALRRMKSERAQLDLPVPGALRDPPIQQERIRGLIPANRLPGRNARTSPRLRRRPLPQRPHRLATPDELTGATTRRPTHLRKPGKACKESVSPPRHAGMARSVQYCCPLFRRGFRARRRGAGTRQRVGASMRILVTGHDGYIGSVLVRQLRDEGHEVVGLDAGYFASGTLGPAPDPVPAVPVDLRDVTAEDIKQVAPDGVVHLAALCNDPLGNLDPDLTYDVNHRATVRLARAAKDAGVPRFLFSSSCSLYGAGDDDTPLAEDADFNPLTPYGESKILSESDVAPLADDDFSPTFLRNATAYGFSPRLRGDLVVNDLVGHALLTGEVKLRSDGMAWRPLVHVEDICAAFKALLAAPREKVHGRAFNIGQTSENYLIRDVAELVAELVGGTVTFAQGSGADARNYKVSCDRIAREIPEFHPQWTVAKGIEQLAEYYRRYGLRLDDLMGEQHQRLKRINQLVAANQLDAQLRWTSAAGRA
jgi:nucleoside-diphosphate-sugar epimerase